MVSPSVFCFGGLGWENTFVSELNGVRKTRSPFFPGPANALSQAERRD